MSHCEVPLTGGGVALVDAIDLPRVLEHRWSRVCRKHTSVIYAKTSIDASTVTLHRFILEPEPRQFVDHANRDGLDNRRANLRVCTPSQNMMNRVSLRMKSGRLRGVAEPSSSPENYCAVIQVDGRGRHLGTFTTAEAAALAYDAAAVELHGEFAVLNFPERLGEPIVGRVSRGQATSRKTLWAQKDRAARFVAGVCADCRQPREPDHRLCSEHRIAYRARQVVAREKRRALAASFQSSDPRDGDSR